MPNFICKTKKNINGFDVFLYEVDLDNKDELFKLEDYLRNKISKMKVHNDEEYISEYLNNPNIDKNFSDAIIRRIKEINTPAVNPIVWFDVRRSRVTEFMSQLLLEREFGCVFCDAADKRINIDPVNVDKHTPGIDVTGIHHSHEGFKFVVCEVKASKEPRIPCSSAKLLLDDIKNGYNNNQERLSREILQYTQDLCKTPSDDDAIISNIIKFLIELIKFSSSKDVLLRNVMFFPFMVRNNKDIAQNLNLNDFADFKEEDLENANLKGIIWSFNNDIDSFCNNLYKEVIINAGQQN